MHDLLDFSEIPHELRNYVPDYPIHVLDICHTADERLLEFPKDLASMFLMIKYQKDFKTLQSVLQSIPELDTVEQETFDTAWNFLDKRMLKFKDKAQNAKGEVKMIQIRPVSDLRNKFPEIETLVNSGNPVYLTKNGYGAMVVLSLEEYASLTDNIEMKLDEADRQAAGTDERLSHESVFKNARSAIHGK